MHHADDNISSTTSNRLLCRVTSRICPILFGGLLVIFGFGGTAHAGGPDATPGIKGKGRLLFQDTFSNKKLRKVWRVHPNSFRIEKGVLIAGQRPDANHGAVCDVLVDFKDVFLEFSFLLDGSAGFNVVIDDRKYRQSHAGHICRVSVRKNRITLGDDKTGSMKNGLFEKRRSPKYRSDREFRKEVNRLLKGKSKSVPVSLKRGRWYRMTVRITGETMQVMLDGKPLTSLRSEGIAHPTKTDFGFTIIGRYTQFDNIAAWSPRPARRK